MRYRFVLVLAGLMLGLWVAPVFGHAADEGGVANAATEVKQAIAFLEGTKDIEAAEMKIKDAMNAEGSEDLNKDKLNQALGTLKKQDVETAKKLLAESLGKDPQTAEELTLRSSYTGSALNNGLLLAACVLILIGGTVVFKVKASH